METKSKYKDVGDNVMILGEMILPQNKFQLIKRIQDIKDVQFKVIDDVTRVNSGVKCNTSRR